MKQKEYDRLIELCNVGGGFTPHNTNASELLEQTTRGEIVSLVEVGSRDLSFHRGYFGLLGYIYDYLPPAFHKKVYKHDFYKFVKHLKGEYRGLYVFKDGTKMIEYDSVAFGGMSQKRFEDYVREQLPFIYENIIAEFFSGDIYSGVINNIEEEYQKFLAKL